MKLVRADGKLSYGTIATIVIFTIGSIVGIVKWYKHTDEDLVVMKEMVKQNSKNIKNLQKCEYNFNAEMAVMKNEIENIKKTLGEP